MSRVPLFCSKSIKNLVLPPRRFYQNLSTVSIRNNSTNRLDGKDDKKGTCKDNNEKTSGMNNFGESLLDRKSNVKVCIIGGGAASIYAAVLLKQSRIIKCVHLIDPRDSMASVVLDASQIDTTTRLKYFKKKNTEQALREINIIALMDEADNGTFDDDPFVQFKAAKNYVREMAEGMVQYSPDSLVAVFVRPVTAMLPMVCEIYKYAGLWNPDRIIGSTSIDSMRMEAIAATLLHLNPAFLSVPVVGGADTNTVVPLLSRARPVNRFTNAEERLLLGSLRDADKEIAETESRGPLTFSAGAAAAKLILTLADGLSGFENIIASAYVRSNVMPVCRFFTSELQFGTCGITKNFGLPKASATEISLIERAIPLINRQVEIAIDTVHKERGGKSRSL